METTRRQNRPHRRPSITEQAGIPRPKEDRPTFSLDLLEALDLVLGPR